MNSIAEIRLSKSHLDVASSNIMTELYYDMQVSFALPERYGNQWVRFARKEPEYPGDIMVSFVFNPITMKVENPATLNGKPDEATPLIDWISEMSLPESMFYRQSQRYPMRCIFLLIGIDVERYSCVAVSIEKSSQLHP